MIQAPSDKTAFEDHKSRLLACVGAQGSGAARYAAAMYFYTERLMPTDMLEIYRRCSKFDKEDPIDLARFEGVKVPQICGACPSETAA